MGITIADKNAEAFCLGNGTGKDNMYFEGKGSEIVNSMRWLTLLWKASKSKISKLRCKDSKVTQSIRKSNKVVLTCYL